MIYDIIGDVHGQADKLKGLLNELGYTLTQHPVLSIYYHKPPTNHRAIFIGDLIDRGPQQLETLQIVYEMIDAGVADAVMGNHEYNALAYATLDDSATASTPTYLRTHNRTHERQHLAFLNEFAFGSESHQYWLERFFDLPLWIETEDACFIHACWDETKMDVLRPQLTDSHCLTPEALQLTGQKDSPEYDAVERLLKGVELPLPEGVNFTDKDGAVRRRMRVKWWLDDLQGKRIVDIARAPKSDLAQIPQDATIKQIDFRIQTDKPIFVGHYWLTGKPMPLSPQVVCTDYSAASYGYLTAYRFDTEHPWPLSEDNFVQYIHN